MVSNYTPNNKYRYDRLDKVVYLISEEAVKNIHIDNGLAYIDEIVQEPLTLSVNSISVNETDTLDERYRFTHQLNFSMSGYANYEAFQGRYYVIIKSVDGVYWLVNPLFPTKITYTYTIDSQSSRTDFSIGTISNHPIVHYTNDGFKDIEYLKNSASFQEAFDGTNITHTLNFNINFDDYKSSWHYNLLEFIQNRYSAIISTTCGYYIMAGFNHLQLMALIILWIIFQCLL